MAGGRGELVEVGEGGFVITTAGTDSRILVIPQVQVIPSNATWSGRAPPSQVSTEEVQRTSERKSEDQTTGWEMVRSCKASHSPTLDGQRNNLSSS